MYRLNHFTFRCSAPIALNALNSEELLTKMIQHSISRAWRLGKAVLDARKQKTSTLSAIIEHENAKNTLHWKCSLFCVV